MAGHPVNIGEKMFPSKAAAISFYRDILDSYEPGDELSQMDYHHLVTLCLKDAEVDDNDIPDAVIVDYHPAHKRTKCFHLLFDEDLYLFSYRMAITGGSSDMQLFRGACRNAVQKRLHRYKEQQFAQRPVKCAITKRVVEWDECEIDHKAPLTFSVIVKSFVVANSIDVSSVEYSFDNFVDEFADPELARKFDDFHRQMAILRVVASEENRKLASSARVTPSQKDGLLDQPKLDS